MTRTIEIPPGMVPVWLDGGGVLVIPIAVYVAGLKLGKRLQRREALAHREGGTGHERTGNDPGGADLAAD